MPGIDGHDVYKEVKIILLNRIIAVLQKQY